MTERHLKVVVDEAHLSETEAVCDAVRQAGMRIETVIAEAGTIFGTAEASLVQVIAQVNGVLRAAPEDSFEIPPDEDAPQ